MGTILNYLDIFQGLQVRKTSDRFCYFDTKRMSWKEIEKLIASGEEIKYYASPNLPVDWTNKSEVIKYHDCFEVWSTYLSTGSSRFKYHKTILEVKDNLVFYNNEYYLPAPTVTFVGKEMRTDTKQTDIEDGLYNVILRKQENAWWAKENVDRGNIYLNIFELQLKIVDTIKDLKPNTNELWASRYEREACIVFEYHKSTWDGLSFELISIDLVALFRKYYIQTYWHDSYDTCNRIVITDKEISDILYPIKDDITYIIKEALKDRDIIIDIDYSYGYTNISNSLKFNQDVTDKVFNLISKQIQNIS